MVFTKLARYQFCDVCSAILWYCAVTVSSCMCICVHVFVSEGEALSDWQVNDESVVTETFPQRYAIGSVSQTAACQCLCLAGF